MTRQTLDIPQPLLDLLDEMGVVEVIRTTLPSHAPVKHPKKPDTPFRRPNFDENGEPDF